MPTTKSLEQIVLTRKRQCSRCKKTMQRGDVAIKYTVDTTGLVQYHATKYWCADCESRRLERSKQDGQP